MFCVNCGAEIPDEVQFCPGCGAKAGKLKEKTAFCRNCGEEISEDAVVCPKCGVATDKFNAASNQPQAQPNIVINNNNENVNTNINRVGGGRSVPRKSKMTTLVLAILLGYLGVHRFYVGKTGSGILYLFTGGLFGIGYIVDIITIITGSFRDKYGYTLV